MATKRKLNSSFLRKLEVKKIENGSTTKAVDSFQLRFNRMLSDTDVAPLEQNLLQRKVIPLEPLANDVILLSREDEITDPFVENSFLYLKRVLLDNVDQSSLTEQQLKLFQLLNSYRDLYCPLKKDMNASMVRTVYCLHLLNHCLKARSKIVKNNAKLQKDNSTVNGEEIDQYRDQGLTRPKVLILVPFKDCVFRLIDSLTRLLFGEESNLNKKTGLIANRKRFLEEFGPDAEARPKTRKPLDFQKLFRGNTDDCFRLGFSVAKRSLKLYVDFYKADVMIASPLGLRLIVGSEEEPADCDFLSSIEILILDQTEVFLMQNWQHMLDIFDHLHRQPKDSHGVDYSRTRLWALNGWSQFYRQTIVFSAFPTPELRSLFSKYCRNQSGLVLLPTQTTRFGASGNITVNLPQSFHRFSGSSDLSTLPDDRYNFFVKKVFPMFQNTDLSHSMIFVSSYFDFVRLRNYFKKEGLSFVQICEYSKDKKISRARDMFFHGKKELLLFTERYHFYRRNTIKGIRHLIFYQLPLNPQFYDELCNMMEIPQDNDEGTGENSLTCTVLYSKYDSLRLTATVGHERATTMLTSDKNLHILVSGE